LASQQLERLDADLARCQESASARQADELKPCLQAALDHRVAREHALANARDALEAAASGLRALDEERLKVGQSLDPLRHRISELKLKEQAASLGFEQFAAQLAAAGADESSLLPELAAARPAALQSALTALQRSIDALGAVNLAALDELEAARERKSYLDAQSDDLTQAMVTLENAIRRIDRETRELLQSTYDSVNRSFGELFPILFGGGEARLMMTGEEILDAGLQVMAQPPGKKNSTIHLLSGGEKALTAIALVFSMFQLNPAPFCLLDEVDAPLDDTNTVDAPLDDTNTERFCSMVRRMSTHTQFLFISHNKITMEMAQQLVDGDGATARRGDHAGIRRLAHRRSRYGRSTAHARATRLGMDMTDLQMGLIGLGAAAVVGVLAYNKWQEHKHRKLAESLLSARQADVLLDEQTSAIDDAGGMTARPDQGRVEPLLDPATKPNVVSAARPVPVDDDEALPASERSAQPARSEARNQRELTRKGR